MTPEQVMMGISGAFAVTFGLVAGSFANVGIARWPLDRSAWGRSACPRCGTGIAFHDNVPVLSWLVLRGRCRSCGEPISPTYPLVELLGGLIGLLLFWRVVPDSGALDAVHFGAFAWALTFATLLIIAAYSDLRSWIVPNEVTIYAVPIGIAGAMALEWAGYDGILAVSTRESVLSATIGGSAFLTLRLVFGRLLGREALGMGDVKLAAMLGAFLGWGLWLVLFLAAFLGMAVHLATILLRGESSYLPYGPTLCTSAAVQLLWGEEILRTFFPGIYWLAQTTA